MTKKRRTFSAQFKFDAVIGLLTAARPPTRICREWAITDNFLCRWKQEFLAQGAHLFDGPRSRTQDSQDTTRRLAELEQMVGRLVMEDEILCQRQLLAITAIRQSAIH